MQILFLGTGAADWPLEKPDTGFFRRNCAALIDHQLLIDPGPGVLTALEEMGHSVSDVRFVINTHRHADHFCPQTLEALIRAGAHFFHMDAGDEMKMGPYTVKALPANHATCEKTVHFLIDDQKRRLFYGLDGAWLTYEEVQAIQKAPVDLAILDATIGDAEGDFRIFEHNNLRMVREMQYTLRPYIRRFCISHMARTLHEDHPELAARMASLGIETAYDGWETTI